MNLLIPWSSNLYTILLRMYLLAWLALEKCSTVVLGVGLIKNEASNSAFKKSSHPTHFGLEIEGTVCLLWVFTPLKMPMPVYNCR